MTHQVIDMARSLAERAHEGQLDKIGAAYIDHPRMVAEMVQALPAYAEANRHTQRDAVVAAWLHDVIEDTDETAEGLRAAGLPSGAVDAVVALTRRADISDEKYYENIRGNPVALLVKTADIASNLHPSRVAQLDGFTRARLARKYADALAKLHVDPSLIGTLHSS